MQGLVQNLGPGKNKRKLPKNQASRLTQARYGRDLRVSLERFHDVIRSTLIPEISGIIAQADAGDARWAARVAGLMAAIRAAGSSTPELAAPRAQRVAEEISSKVANKIGRQVKAGTGMDVGPVFARGPLRKADAETPNVLDDTAQITAFIIKNVALIKDIADVEAKQIESVVLESITAGRRASDIEALILERIAIGNRRAKNIARDQVAKLHGQLTRARQVSLGVGEYIWRTALDERVRESHLRLEGTVHSWDSPPVINGRPLHPGDDYNCRCHAEPIFFPEEAQSGPTSGDRTRIKEVRARRARIGR